MSLHLFAVMVGPDNYSLCIQNVARIIIRIIFSARCISAEMDTLQRGGAVGGGCSGWGQYTLLVYIGPIFRIYYGLLQDLPTHSIYYGLLQGLYFVYTISTWGQYTLLVYIGLLQDLHRVGALGGILGTGLVEHITMYIYIYMTSISISLSLYIYI